MGRTRRGCEGCREKHSKCDDSIPTCHNCLKLGVQCIRIVPIRYVSAHDIRHRRGRKLPSVDTDSSTGPVTSPENFFLDQVASLPNIEQEPSPVSAYTYHGFDGSNTKISSQQRFVRSDFQPSADSDQYRQPHAAGSFNPSTFEIAPPPPTWLQDEKEVYILKHYIDVLSNWLDFCDTQRTFGIAVPQLAASHSPLLSAILAVSSKHLSILTGQNVLSAARYYQKCLTALIPLLNDESAVMNDVILAVIVILRLSEELESPVFQAASPSHMKGIRECVRAQGRIAPRSRLRYAALCVMVRQENYLALMNACPIGWELDAFTIPRDPDPSDELSWTMLVVRLCADLVQFSNDEQSRQGSNRWQHLKTLNEQWKLSKPRSFEPVFAKEANRALGDPFPKSWFLQVWHSTSIQHYHLNCVLLAASDPHVPRFGPGHQEAHRKAENEILNHMRHICGIALVNTDLQPCMVTAYMSISICGDRFTDRLEQEGMFELLMKVNKQFGWPTLSLQKQLKESWGWR